MPSSTLTSLSHFITVQLVYKKDEGGNAAVTGDTAVTGVSTTVIAPSSVVNPPDGKISRFWR